MIKPAIGTAPRSTERADALLDIAAKARPCRGTSKPPAVKTLRLWLQDHEERGLAGLLPEASARKGKAEVLVSRLWDSGIDLPKDRRGSVAAALDRYTLSLIAKSISARKARVLVGKRLVELSEGTGSALNRAHLEEICRVTHKYTDRFADWTWVARHDLDDKDKPRIARGRSKWPMDLVWGDVHPIDIVMPPLRAKGRSGFGSLHEKTIAPVGCGQLLRYWARVRVFGKPILPTRSIA